MLQFEPIAMEHSIFGANIYLLRVIEALDKIQLPLESKSCFHFMTASNVALRVTSNTINAPTASL